MLLSSKILHDKILSIINENKNNAFVIKCIIKSFEDDELNVELDYIDAINVEENFFEKYADDITLYVHMRPLDFMNILEFKTSLYCAIRIDYIDMETGDLILDEDPEIYYFLMFLKNTEDVFKKYHISAFSKYHEEDVPDLESHEGSLIPITFQLLEQDAYELHKKYLVGMYSNVNVESMLKYISKNFQIEKLDLYDVDNTVLYRHFIIPPEYSRFDQIFNYIQNKYGVYRNGLNYYFHRGIFYIYPAFDTKISRKVVLNIYRGPRNTYGGMKNYFKETIDGDTTIIDIVSIGDMKSIKLTENGLENIGTNVIFIKSDKIIDKFIKLENDEFYINDDNLLNISSSFTQSALKNSSIPKYIKPTINLFKASSILEQYNNELVILTWPLARLFKVIPGAEVHFYYDKEEIQDKSGIVDSITYKIFKQKFKTDTPSFSIEAILSVRINEDIK